MDFRLRAQFILLIFVLFTGCDKETTIVPAVKDGRLISYVNPFIGTGGHGHTYPGASMPFGMMQLSPDTRLSGWDGCSGYHYSDEYIYGFSHTHLSGTGVSDYGDLLLMPTDTLIYNNGSDGRPGYRAHFNHKNEKASPGFYEVLLDSTDIKVELTVSRRAGIHRYSYFGTTDQYLVIDLEHRDELIDYGMHPIGNNALSGFRRSKAWAEDQHLYFYMEFSHPFDVPEFFHRTPDRRSRMAGLRFINPDNEPVEVRVGISAVDIEGAKRNMEAEVKGKSFDQLKEEAEKIWESQLEKIVVESEDKDNKTNFYTSMYHSVLAPNLYSDVDGRYRGMDLEIHQVEGFDYYTVFSLWDTYRATHPLYTIIEPERTNDFVNTFLAKYDEGGIMPIWDLAGNYTGCMIGYHAVPVIADAYLKGIRGYDTEKAFAAMKESAVRDHLGLSSYKEYGFIPMESEPESVSKTLEYAYDDWTIAQMAKSLGKTGDYQKFIQRAQAYKNLYDKESGFFRGRLRNSWFSPFDPYEVNFNYTEANAWQYSTYVPQDISGLMKLMGGKDSLEAHLDRLFTAEDQTSGREQADITGLIGQYAHGNEPSHHMAYLYNFVNAPFKTQERVHQILTELYKPEPDGISGNEDCGQMSSWYIFSSLGFYPVTPGSNQYVIGSPLFDKATIDLQNGEYFTVVADQLSPGNLYIEKAFLNGESLNRSFLTHDEIVAGGILHFEMTNTPSSWATDDSSVPVTSIDDLPVLPPPAINGATTYRESTEIELTHPMEDAQLFYSINEGEYSTYRAPLELTEVTSVTTYAKRGDLVSDTLKTPFSRIDPDRKLRLESTYANQYNGGGKNALIDGVKGTRDFRTGAWQGYQGTDVVAIVDLGKIQPIDSINVSFLQDQRSWIFYPKRVRCSIAPGNVFYKSLPQQEINSEKQSDGTAVQQVSFPMKGYSARYIKIVAETIGDLPDWHLGAPMNGKAWIFIDEIEIK